MHSFLKKCQSSHSFDHSKQKSSFLHIPAHFGQDADTNREKGKCKKTIYKTNTQCHTGFVQSNSVVLGKVKWNFAKLFLQSFNNKVCSKSNLPPQIAFANLSLRLWALGLKFANLKRWNLYLKFPSLKCRFSPALLITITISFPVPEKNKFFLLKKGSWI